MKKILLIINVLFLSLLSFAADDQPEKAGDNLDLDAVLNLFEKSESVEDFENQLNSEKNDVNNLDLNEDGFVDYIRVIDYSDGNTHSLTLQVPYSDEEAQDVAVIHIEEEGKETSVQIVGDEELYGTDYIVEPGDDKSDAVVNAYNWKPVRHIYSPRYVIWVSPWRYGRYPSYYRPWKPVPWSVYRAHPRHHHVHCRRVTVYRSHHAHNHYHKHRKHSHTYHAHHKNAKQSHGKSNHNRGKNKKVTKSVNPSPTSPTSPGAKNSNTQRQSTGKPTKRPGGRKSGGGKKSGGNKGGKKGR
jgi:hypothetical protein